MNIERRNISKFELEKVVIPDPLEGIIEGSNRYERSKNFMLNVWGNVWPQDNNSGEYGRDLWRPTRWKKGDITGYTQSAPNGKDPLTVTAEEFENMVANVGPDYLRVRIVPPQLLKPTKIIPVGGSCILETWGMRNMNDIQTGVKKGLLPKELLAEAARRMVEIAPTNTHLSGALLSGQDASVLLQESDMWKEMLTRFGIPENEAKDLTNEAYDRIHEGVARRANLINPDATITQLDFDELPLKEAIGKWFEEIGIPYNPVYRLAEVGYTYYGPQQRELVLATLRNKIQNGKLDPEDKKAAMSLLWAEYYVRLKQIDHLRWESLGLPNEVIIGKREMTHEEEKKYQNDYIYRMKIDAFRDVYKRHINGNPDVLTAGFADLPYQNKVQHETRDVGLIFRGTATTDDSKSIETFNRSLKRSLDPNNPVRLHRLNVEKHLSFLRAHFREDDLSRQPKEVKEWIANFPLSKNPFFIDSTQYMYDRDFDLFAKEAVDVQTARSNGTLDRKESNQKMQRLTERIYPNLEANINYSFGRSNNK